MFRHIVISLDGSPRAEAVLPVAARLARASGGQLTFLRVVPPSIELDMHTMPLATTTELSLEGEIARANDYLTQLASSEELKGINIRTEALSGPAAKTILLFAHLQQVDLIVMCSHGSTGLKRWVLGSVSEKVARHSPIPVLVLHEDGPKLATTHGTPAHPERFLVPLDGSALAEAALTPAVQLCAALAAPGRGALQLALVLRLVPVPEEEHEHIARMNKQAIADAKTYLQTITERLQQGEAASLGLMVSASVIVDIDVAGTLIRVAEHGEGLDADEKFDACDAIAMATHGGSNLAYWAMGSVTERVLHGSKLPLLIVRPEEIMSKASLGGDQPNAVALPVQE
jgi:nucleotide-binding universal stress UspA family protein